jgi:hypothetical protein
MTTRHFDNGELTPTQLSLLQLAQVRDVSAQAGTPRYADAMALCADGYLCPLDGSTAAPLAASSVEQFTITAAGYSWHHEHGYDDDEPCRCRICSGRG